MLFYSDVALIGRYTLIFSVCGLTWFFYWHDVFVLSGGSHYIYCAAKVYQDHLFHGIGTVHWSSSRTGVGEFCSAPNCCVSLTLVSPSSQTTQRKQQPFSLPMQHHALSQMSLFVPIFLTGTERPSITRRQKATKIHPRLLLFLLHQHMMLQSYHMKILWLASPLTTQLVKYVISRCLLCLTALVLLWFQSWLFSTHSGH